MTKDAKRPIAKMYRRSLAAADSKLGWCEIPDCPLDILAGIMGHRAQAHPEKDVPTAEYRARVVSEKIWHSTKLRNVQPSAWAAEYPWLLPIAFVDGTFEADDRDIWARAYAYGRPDWTPEKVGQLLDEFERVGLLRRTKDEDGKVWGFWVGADNFLPPPSHRERYKAGKRHLFGDIKDTSLIHQGELKDMALTHQEISPSGIGSGVDVDKGIGTGTGFGLNCAAKDSEKEQSNLKGKSAGESPRTSKPAPKPTATPKPAATKREILPPAEYYAAKHVKDTQKTVTELEAEARAWREANGYELCTDDIWRPHTEREALGFTVKEDNLWRKQA